MNSFFNNLGNSVRGMKLELVDKVINEYDAEEVNKILEIKLLCTQASTATRPTMSE